MNKAQKQEILAMARVKFGIYTRDQLKKEYQRKLLLKEFYLLDYSLTPAELLALFETLVSEKSR